MTMTYAGTGVSYDAMDPFKKMAQLAARETAGNIARLNGGEFKEFANASALVEHLNILADTVLAGPEVK